MVQQPAPTEKCIHSVQTPEIRTYYFPLMGARDAHRPLHLQPT